MTSSTKSELYNCGGANHGHRQHVQEFEEIWTRGVQICERTERQTDIPTYIHVDHNTWYPYWGRSINIQYTQYPHNIGAVVRYPLRRLIRCERGLMRLLLTVVL